MVETKPIAGFDEENGDESGKHNKEKHLLDIYQANLFLTIIYRYRRFRSAIKRNWKCIR